LQVAGFHVLIGRRDGGRCIHRRLLSQQPLDERPHHALGLRALEAVERAPVAEGVDGGDRLDAQLVGQRLVLVDVDLRQAHLAAVAAHDLLQDRGQLLARPAPLGPEIDQHRRLARGLQHVLGEGRNRHVLDDVPGRRLLRTPRFADA
jgi:hypothetical protein